MATKPIMLAHPLISQQSVSLPSSCVFRHARVGGRWYLPDALDYGGSSTAEYQTPSFETLRASNDHSSQRTSPPGPSRAPLSSAEIVAVCTAARQSVEHCRPSPPAVHRRHKRYGIARSEDGLKEIDTRYEHKEIWWHITEKEAVVNFRAAIAADSSASTSPLPTASGGTHLCLK
ncbi:uncharacterized protein PV07_08636 [Cladophialophora immunda]|uniref:Uncharacterized protein n=1 Tax=Cladophialophora immunda TaxID=569365 RepID=A0A0D2C4U7_9EURO|nr:uncharacterized protein PV07_08636 [Cladophialophora immunda]KIW25470.1 hypothetical protein PV07_08636 [Cladophialophora immunda]